MGRGLLAGSAGSEHAILARARPARATPGGRSGMGEGTSATRLKPMTNWEFLLIFWAVLLGAGVHTLLSGMGAVILTRKEKGIYLPQVVWASIHIFLFLTIWYFLFKEQEQQYTFGRFIVMFCVYAVMFLISTLTFPANDGSATTCKEHYYQVRVPYFSLWAVLFAIPLLRTILEPSFTAGGPHIFIYFGSCLAGILSPNPRLHAALPWVCISTIALQLTGVLG